LIFGGLCPVCAASWPGSFLLPEKAGILNRGPIRELGEGFQADIDAHLFV
jgi:hypothetical protein